MQILPLLTTSDSATTDTISSLETQTASRQAALFSSLLSGYSATGTTSATAQTIASTAAAASTDTTSATSTLAAANTPSQEELMRLPVTKEDIAALHDALQTRGFSDDEITSLENKASSDSGMTWGDLMSEVNKKKASTDSSKKKDVSVDDQTQLLGLFGKLGFTTEQSQQLIDSLAKGNVDSVWSAVNAKVSSLSEDSSVSLGSSEMTALARAMSLSDSAQERLTKLFDQSNADQGLSGNSLKTAFTLVQNERNTELAQESESMEAFRQAASTVLSQAWQRNSTQERSGIHEDDVARKAAQVVSMSGVTTGKRDASGLTGGTTSGKLDVLADVPQEGQGLTSGKDQASQAAKTMADGVAQPSSADALADLDKQLGQPAQSTQHVAQEQQSAASDKQSAKTATAAKVQQLQADTNSTHADVATEQSGTASALGKDALTGSGQGQEKTAAPNGAAATATSSFVQSRDTGNSAGDSSGQSGTSGKDGWGTFWSKVKLESGTDTSSASSLGQTGFSLNQASATTGLKSQVATNANQTTDPGAAFRAAQQLESGLLRNLGQGTKQLTLNLHPDELGKLSVTLTVKGKEVQATIKADSNDTAAMLHEQSAQIRQTLENQGFKVSKLDVQTGLAQDNQSAWQGPEQHNQAREQREAMERVRASARLSQSTNDMAFDVSQADVISGSMTSGAQGLDLFA